MSTEDHANAAQWNDKNLLDRPEADEDARTESSEGSSSKEQWAPDVMDSEDEFEDAMEPPSSGMLMTFEGAMPPLSGVYEDAVEATPEQIAAALESTSSNGSGGGRHSMILEEDEEGDTAETDLDDEVVAVVEGIVESTAAAEEEVTPDGDAETVAEEASAEQERPDLVEDAVVEDMVQDAEETTEEGDSAGDCVVVAGESNDGEGANDTDQGVRLKVNDEVEAAAGEDMSPAVEEEVTADEVAEREEHDGSEGDEVPASEADSEVQEQAQSTEETTSEVGESEAVDETAEVEVAPATRKNEEVSDDEDVVAESDDASDEPAEGTAAVEVDATAEDVEMEVAVTEEGAGAELEAAVDGSSQDAATDAVQEIEMTLEDAEVPAPEREAIMVVEAGRFVSEDAETEEPTVAEIATAEEVDVEVDAGDEANASVTEAAGEASAENEEATQPENNATEVSAPIDDLTASEVEVAVAQVTEELVEAVQSALELDDADAQVDEGKISEAEQVTEDGGNEDANEALEEKSAVVTLEVTDVPEQDAEAASTDETESENDPDVNNSDLVEVAVETQADAEEHPAEDEPVVAAASKELVDGSRRKSGDEQSHAVVGLLPRLGTSSAPTTGTATEPFIMSCESNDMLDVPVPPQRWSYEVYGFSIEKRVVLYHVHKTDRRAGVREPPILKRYTDFFNLETNLLGSCLRAAADIPRIPRPHLGTVLRGYKSKKTIEVREKAFRQQLRYVAQYPELHGSEIFERFISTSRTTTGAGWM